MDTSGSTHDCIRKILNVLKQPNKRINFGPFGKAIEANGCKICSIFTHLAEQAVGTKEGLTCGRRAEIPYVVEFANYKGVEKIDDVPDLTSGELKEFGVDVTIPYDVFFNRHERLPKNYDEGDVVLWPNTAYHFRLVDLSTHPRHFPQAIEMADSSTTQRMRDGTIGSEFLVSWLDFFMRYHGDNCPVAVFSTTMNLPASMRLIDADTMSIVNAPPDATYVALSYVWGANYASLQATQSNIALLMKPGGLLQAPMKLARTVSDAITVVRKLHMRYLWVDSLCIIQDDLEDKLDQISSMSIIYEAAEVTIVAAFGNHANAGIPGVEADQYVLRTERLNETIHEEVKLSSLLPDLRDNIGSGSWSSRAWTFQEALLSKIQLSFAPSQAHLSCPCGYATDEVHAFDVFQTHGLDPQVVDKVLVPLEYLWVYDTYSRERDCLWNEYHALLMDFTTRKLTNPSDILSAFSAVLSNLEEKWKTSFVFGLPVSHLIPSLLWEPTDSGDDPKRRECMISFRQDEVPIHCPIPSWSWAGWYGAMSLALDVHDPDADCQYQPSEIDAEWKLSSWGMDLTTDDPVRHTLLQAEVWTARFIIGPLESEEEASRRDDYRKHPIYRIEQGEIIGHIQIPLCSYWPLQGDNRPDCEFIAITCGIKSAIYARHFLGHHDDDDEDDPLVVDAMLVSQQSNGIAYRVGIAGIHWDDWMEAGPVRKQITLG